MNNAGIVDRVDCACKLNCVPPPDTQNPPHALLNTHLCIDSDEYCIPILDTIVPDNNTLLGDTKVSLHMSSTSTLSNDRELVDIVPITQHSAESHWKAVKPFTCRFLRKKNSDKHGTNRSISPVSDCICKTHKWKFPTIVQKAWKHNRRVRLKSNPSFNNMPLQRYQSHHSSSDEDWFEEIADDEASNLDDMKNQCNSNENKPFTNADNLPTHFKHESDCVTTNRFKWCSPYAFRKLYNKQPLTQTKIARRDQINSCRIV